MDRIKKYLLLGIFIALAVACWGEFVLCFARGYNELWYTILVPSVIVTALAAAAFFTKAKWLNAVATVIVLVGAALLIGFPDYTMFLALILGGASLVAETVLLVMYVREKRRD